LLRIPAFRKLLITLLADRTMLGTVTRDAHGITYKHKGGSGGMGMDLNKDTDSKIGDKSTFRVCDEVAINLVALKGSPAYNPVWKDSKRNQALKELQRYLSTIGKKVDKILPEYVLQRYRD
jgi:hypothetical protein